MHVFFFSCCCRHFDCVRQRNEWINGKQWNSVLNSFWIMFFWVEEERRTYYQSVKISIRSYFSHRYHDSVVFNDSTKVAKGRSKANKGHKMKLRSHSRSPQMIVRINWSSAPGQANCIIIAEHERKNRNVFDSMFSMFKFNLPQTNNAYTVNRLKVQTTGRIKSERTTAASHWNMGMNWISMIKEKQN